ncbi:hypothetical protein CK203_112349 [Vitis vinifera]|uniref:Uncharacterized protein n=1 Tax=Vitis vinifera TaxID=29760 RepID=A0A438CEM2_VITVI|nr:hypothetical protein CK203_112349 [Vitis vinifera]
MMMNPNFQKVMMKTAKPERNPFIIFSFFFILFLCAIASINGVRIDTILKFGGCTFFSHNSSSSDDFLTLNYTSDPADDDIRILIGILTLPTSTTAGTSSA